MTASPDLPDVATLKRMRRQGQTLREIAEAFEVTPAAVWRRLGRAEGEGGALRTVEEMTGWTILPRHQNTAVMRQLTTFNRMEQGVSVPALHEEDLLRWVRELNDAGAVLDYHPEAPPNDVCRTGGFFLRGREDGDGFFAGGRG